VTGSHGWRMHLHVLPLHTHSIWLSLMPALAAAQRDICRNDLPQAHLPHMASHAEANGAAGQPAQPSAAAKKSNAEPEAAWQRKKSAEPQQRYPTPEPQEMEGEVAEPQPAHAADKVKKKKRLTKAADMGKTPQGMEGDRPPGAGVKRKLQVPHHYFA